ncbi:hypothetical protein KKG29_05435 [Patescibacteria group bacterium]|nr:hypothetical protein [Patescibacteria group bacterium]
MGWNEGICFFELSEDGEFFLNLNGNTWLVFRLDFNNVVQYFYHNVFKGEIYMAEIHFKAFLSCSFAEEDRDIIDFFKKIIQSFNITPLVYDYQEIGRLTDKVKENIIQSDCLIAILNRRNKIEGNNYWTCSDWIQHEIAIANAYKKPIAIFIEDNVKIEGLIGLEERRQRFNQQHLIQDVDKIITFLFNLRKYLESVYHSGLYQAPPLLRHYIHAKDELISEEKVIERTEILMESLIDELEATHHAIELEETTPNLSIKPQSFDFKCIEKPSGTIVKSEIKINTDYKFFWRILFTPPLKRGERVKYAFKEVRSAYRPYYYETMMERINQGTYEYKEPKCEACEWEMSYPTYELHHEMAFPENYEITNYYPFVISDQAKVKAEDELKRIKAGNMFSAEKIFDKWVLKLKVPKPLLNHIYYTYFLPPKREAQK